MKIQYVLIVGLLVIVGWSVYLFSTLPIPVGSTHDVVQTPIASSTQSVSIVSIVPTGILPDTSITPGVVNPNITQDNIDQNICAGKAWSTGSIRPDTKYTGPLKVKELNDGYTFQGDTNPSDYELDHLISLELGGSPTDPQNLWPEPYCTNGTPCKSIDPRAKTDPYGAKAKDTVENYLHTQVCAGQITLDQAQQEVATNWHAVYEQIDTVKGSVGGVGIPGSDDPDDN